MALYLGSNKKRVALGGQTIIFATWDVTLTGITVTTPPTKTRYEEGEVFDPTGMVVTATYSNGITKEITNYTIANGDQLSADMTTVVISYTERGVTVTTEYKVKFASATPTIVIDFVNSVNNMFNSGMATLNINGTNVTSVEAQLTYSLNIGDTITFTSLSPPVMVVINGETVQEIASAIRTYTYYVKSNAQISVIMMGALRIDITEE